MKSKEIEKRYSDSWDSEYSPFPGIDREPKIILKKGEVKDCMIEAYTDFGIYLHQFEPQESDGECKVKDRIFIPYHNILMIKESLD